MAHQLHFRAAATEGLRMLNLAYLALGLACFAGLYTLTRVLDRI